MFLVLSSCVQTRTESDCRSSITVNTRLLQLSLFSTGLDCLPIRPGTRYTGRPNESPFGVDCTEVLQWYVNHLTTVPKGASPPFF